MSWPAPTFKDASTVAATTAARCGIPALSCPIAGVTTEYVLKEPWMQLLTDYSTFAPLSINSAHPEYTGFYLVEETPRVDQGGGFVRWERVYAKIPSQHIEYESYAYSFIGYYGVWGINVTVTTGRDRKTRVVPCKVVYDYFLCNGSGGTPTPGDISITQETKYYASAGSAIEVDYLADSPPFASATSPSRTTYQGYISADDATASSFSIVAEASQISRWMGNIWQRRTKYVKAL